MTALPLHAPATDESLRVFKGRRLRRPSLAPWMIVVLIAIFAFLGLGFARTSLDRSAFELAELYKAIEEESVLNRQLSLQIARLENPARIAPLAGQLGLVIPDETNRLLVDLTPESPFVAEADSAENQ